MNKQISPKIVALIFGVIVIVFLAAFYAVAWQEPAQAPPGGNVAAPLNVSDIEQTKEGNLNIGVCQIQADGSMSPNCNSDKVDDYDAADLMAGRISEIYGRRSDTGAWEKLDDLVYMKQNFELYSSDYIYILVSGVVSRNGEILCYAQTTYDYPIVPFFPGPGYLGNGLAGAYCDQCKGATKYVTHTTFTAFGCAATMQDCSVESYRDYSSSCLASVTCCDIWYTDLRVQ